MTEAKIAFGIYAREGMRNPKANKTKTPVNVGCTLFVALSFLHEAECIQTAVNIG